jgi:excisionase family DNA binding protein
LSRIAVVRRPRYFSRMNNDQEKPFTVTITGMITIAGDDWEKLMDLRTSRTPETPPQARNPKVPEGDGKMPRLAFSVKETAELLGISQKTVYRLICRGLLNTSLTLRTKLIARSEIERFLRDTSREV